MATLATLIWARGLTLAINDSRPIPVDGWLVEVANTRWAGFTIAAPLVVIAYVVGQWVRSRTKVGLYTAAIGGGPDSARRSGIAIDRYIIGLFVATGVVVGVAAALTVGQLGSASPYIGTELELDAIIAVVIGGTSLAGGYGSVSRTAVGVTFMSVLNSGLLNLGLTDGYYQSARGLVLIGVLSLQILTRRLVVRRHERSDDFTSRGGQRMKLDGFDRQRGLRDRSRPGHRTADLSHAGRPGVPGHRCGHRAGRDRWSHADRRRRGRRGRASTRPSPTVENDIGRHRHARAQCRRAVQGVARPTPRQRSGIGSSGSTSPGRSSSRDGWFREWRQRGFGRVVLIGSSAGITVPVQRRRRCPDTRRRRPGRWRSIKSIAGEYAGAGVTANALAPTLIDTGMLGTLDADYRSSIPVGRYGTPAEVAALVVFLCSSHAGYITGEIVDINGGFLID